MRVILHIGMPKTGSSALQRAFVATRRQLRKKGILYPKGTLNHNFLIAGLAAPDRIGRVFDQHYDGDHEAVRSDFADFWRNIVQSVERHSPSVVVLSAESLFGQVGLPGAANLRTLLAPLGGRTEVVCYVRRPSDYYLSMVQQRLKAAWTMRPVGPVGYRAPLESAMAAADAVHVVRYDRSLFPQGDIVADFASRFMPEAAADLCAVADPKVNTSMSAEAMDIVQAFRRDHHRDEDDRFTPDTGMLRRRLAEREAELGGVRRPQLLPHVRGLVDQSSVDLIWLRDTFGIVFDGIDYGAIGPASGFHPKSVGDVCVVDPERREALSATAGIALPIDSMRKRAKPRTVFSRRSGQ
jgi:hypothetical protein